MKVFSHKNNRTYDYKIHYGIGNSVKTVCGVILSSRRVMVNLFGSSDGVIITDDISKVTCKRCLASRPGRLLRLVAIEMACPGIFDHAPLCGEEWLFSHALDVSQKDIEALSLEVQTGERSFTLGGDQTSKDRREILKILLRKGGK